VVGLGSIAKKMHLPVLSTFKDIEILAVAEMDEDRGRKTANIWNIPHFYSDYNEMYRNAELDGVFICLPNFLHYEAVKNALQHEINVFCEKPMGLNSQEAFKLVQLAEKKGLKLAVGYNRRLDNNYQDASKIVKSMQLGRVLQINGTFVSGGPYIGWIPSSEWFFKDKYGVLYDSGPHLVDLIQHTISDTIAEVSANGISSMHGTDIYDNIAGVFKTGNDILGSFNIGWRAGVYHESIQVHGTGCSLFVDPNETLLKHAAYGPLDKISDNISSTKNIIGTFMGKTGDTDLPDETFFKEDRAFIDSILNEGEPSASGEEALRVMEVLDGIRESLKSHSSIKVLHHEL
jgi:predicted dehydrogenase